MWVNNKYTLLATLLVRVNKQNFKVEFKNIFLFFLTVLFCCDVGVSGLELKVTRWGSYKSSNFKGLKSENEVFYGKLLLVKHKPCINNFN